MSKTVRGEFPNPYFKAIMLYPVLYSPVSYLFPLVIAEYRGVRVQAFAVILLPG
jgi:hypothetical protein